MTLTPDRKKRSKRCTSAAQGFDPAGADSEESPAIKSFAAQPKRAPRSLRDQLEAAGLDLSEHPLADRFDAIPAIPADDDAHPAEPATSGGTEGRSAGPAPVCDPAAVEDGASLTPPSPLADSPVLSGTEGQIAGTEGQIAGSASEVPATGPAPDTLATTDPARRSESDSGPVSHPLLTDQAWRDLARTAPELTASIECLEHLKNELRSFDRPMGPEEALLVIDGVETATRVLEGVSALALSVFDRCGTPTDLGAKTTKALVQNRHQLTGAEATRRTELAKNIGGQVSMSGQAVEPLCPVVAESVHAGVLSAGQAGVIGECLQKLPTWVSPQVRAETEKTLVEHAPQVRVTDLRVIFTRLLDEIDPDGQEPADGLDRSRYRVNLRARRNGDWDLSGLLDAITGGVLHGLLTSRIQTAEKTNPGTGAAGAESAGQEMLEIFDAVLSGDRYDAPLLPTGSPDATDATDATDAAGRAGSAVADGSAGGPGGVGVRADGTLVDVRAEQGSVKNQIYERFATLMSRIDMTRVAAGAPYALVVTAKAEDLASQKGAGVTGVETPVPISELVAGGLNGSVFFHLMSRQAKTVQVATEKRFANARQIAILTARDQGCTFPGCETPPGWCDVHHIVPWSEGGRTDVNNLTLACGRHHHLIDKSDWYAVMLVDGRPAWVPPASVDPAREPILHARFIARQIIDTLFD